MCYSDIIFLDAQSNVSKSLIGWGYIAPATKDRTGVAAESDLLEESFNFYIFVILSMVEMEPWFKLSHIKFIHGDLGIMKGLLEALGISEMCIFAVGSLASEWCHLAMWAGWVSLWPHSGKTEEHAQCPYLGLLAMRDTGSKKVQNLAAGWTRYTLQETEGCIGEVSSVTAEQNHSSVIAAVGKESMNLSLTKHMHYMAHGATASSW